MARTCIICGQAAGSKEHVFPAALGGRRTNKGIYCTTHNNGFGRHVAVLEQQLAMFNAILMVRHDRRDAPKPFLFSGKDGHHFSLLGQNIETAAPPSIDALGLNSGDKVNLKFRSMKQFEAWRDAQRKEGWEPQVTGPMEVQRHHVVEPENVSLTFGGPEGLQAVGYLALTFFAQHFPAEARQNGLDPFKAFLKLDFSKEKDQGVASQNLVWWDGRDAEQVAGENSFEFGHAVVVGISAEKSRAYAYISFFSCLNFGIDLGPIEEDRAQMVRVFIDPKAEAAPADVQVETVETFAIEMDPAKSDLGKMIYSGSAQAALRRFTDKLNAWRTASFIEEIRAEVADWANSQSMSRRDFAMTLVDKHSQRVLNLLSQVVSELREYCGGMNAPEPIFKLLDSIVESDDRQKNGLSVQANAFLTLAKAAIAKALENELGAEDPNPEQIAMLLAGGPGMAEVTQIIIQPLLSNLPH